MEKVYLYTEDFSFLKRLKNTAKKIFKKKGGPDSVKESLLLGLETLGLKYSLNSKYPTSSACVLSGKKSLRWAIEQKNLGKIKKIFAGPNIVISPLEDGGLLRDNLIDIVLVPSQWVKDFYLKIAPELNSKIQIWAAGVDLPKNYSLDREDKILVFNKLGQHADLYKKIIDNLKVQNLNFEILSYGAFKQQDFFKALNRCKSLIYLSSSESEGLASLEAWARNVPTLVWEKGFFELNGIRILGDTASPYLSAQAGMRFKDFIEFKEVLPKFLNTKFSPRDYVEQNFTNKICTQKYLDLCSIKY